MDVNLNVHFDDVFKSLKDHVKRHKVDYSFGAGIAVAGIACYIMRSTIALGGMDESDALGGSTNIASHSFLFHSPQTIHVTTVLDRDGRGHPGWPVRNLETRQIFFSQREAAKTFDIPEGRLSGHIKGLYPDVDGLHFERINLAQA